MTAVPHGSGAFVIAPVIDDKLRSVRQRKLTLSLVSVALVGAAVLIFGMLLAMLCDWLTLPGNGAWRPWFTGASLVAAAATVIVGAWRATVRERRLDGAAADIDQALPELQERWSTLAESVATADDRRPHPAMMRQLAREAAAFAPRVQPGEVVSPRSLFRSSLALLAAVVALSIPVFVNHNRAAALIARFWSPRSDISLTHIHIAEDKRVVAEGETVPLEATISGDIPRCAELRIRDEAGAERSVRLSVDPEQGLVSHRVSDARGSFAFRWQAGDALSAWTPVEVARRPKIAKMLLQVTPPQYTGRPVVSRNNLPPRIQVIEGSDLVVRLRPAEPVTELRLEFGDKSARPLTADKDGWYVWSTKVSDGFSFAPVLVESHGLKNREGRPCRVEMYRDQAPSVKVISPTAEMAVQPNENVAIDFLAKDDFAISSAELVVYGEETADDKAKGGERKVLKTIPIDLGAMRGAKEVKGSVQLDLSQFQLQDGQSISYAVRVSDNRAALADPKGAMPLDPSSVADRAKDKDSSGQEQANASPSSQAMGNEAGASSPDAARDKLAGEKSANNNSRTANSATGKSATDKSATDKTVATGATADSTTKPSSPDGSRAAPLPSREGPGEGQSVAAQNATDPSRAVSSQPNSVAQNDSTGAKSNDRSSTGKSQMSNSPDTENVVHTLGESTNPADANAEADASTMKNELDKGRAALAKNDTTTAGEQRSGSNVSPNADSTSGNPSANKSASSPDKNSSQASAGGAKSNADNAPANRDPSTESKSGQLRAASDSSPKAEDSTRRGESPTQPTSDEKSQAESKNGGGQDSNPNASATSQQRTLRAGKKSAKEQQDSGQQSSSGGGAPHSDDEDEESPDEQKSGGGQSQQGDVSVPDGMVNLDKKKGKKAKDPADKNSEKSENAAKDPESEADPGAAMTRRMLDIPQSTSSSQMQIKIDKHAGTFDGQRREKLALAISPVLFELGRILVDAEKLTSDVAQRLERSEAWQGDLPRNTERAEKLLQKGDQVVAELRKKSAGTPYAFIGLQLGLISQSHLTPARDALWEARDSEGHRAELVRSAWQEIMRARKQLEELTATFERIHRDHKLAEKAEAIKKMYQVFIEDTLTMLAPQKNGVNDYERKKVEFDFDEEYLKRLKEVLKMRRDLQAELAKLLSDDPRLMRRFMDRLVGQGDTLRDQITLLDERQKQLGREVRAWVEADDQARPALLEAITRLHHTRLDEIASVAALHNEKFVTWLPLNLRADHSAFEESLTLSKGVAAQAQALAAAREDKTGITEKARKLYNQLGELDASLRRIDLGADQDNLSGHVINRLAEVRKLTTVTSAWLREAELLSSGDYWQMAAIEQYSLATDTDVLAGKLANIDTQIAAMMSQNGTTTPAISKKAHELLATLDKELSTNQLAASFALRKQQGPTAVEKETAAVVAFDKVEQLFDELIKTTIEELDKLPVQDPVAGLLEDPTLDELLTELENESKINELLGIPGRPNNLRIIGDWMRPNQGGGGGGGGGENNANAGRMISNQLRRDADRARRNAERMYKNATARALHEQKRVRTARPPAPKDVAAKDGRRDWNVLLSILGDELLQGKGEMPPEEYRRAIEQYMTRISRIEGSADAPDESPEPTE